MFDLWYEFFYNHLFNSHYAIMDDIEFTYGTASLFMNEYLSGLLATIMCIVIYVICCLCVWKVIKLIGRFFVRF